MADTQAAIESALQEHRLFPPPPAFVQKAPIKSKEEYLRFYRAPIDQPEQLWARMPEELHWFKKWDRVLEWKAPYAKWFIGGKTNLSYNCLDRQIAAGRGNKTAILWEGEPETHSGSGGEIRKITFKQLRDDVC